MCIRKFFTYTFSNRKAFNQAKKEVEENHGIDTIKGELCRVGVEKIQDQPHDTTI